MNYGKVIWGEWRKLDKRDTGVEKQGWRACFNMQERKYGRGRGVRIEWTNKRAGEAILENGTRRRYVLGKEKEERLFFSSFCG
jgi:hypothetical protein